MSRPTMIRALPQIVVLLVANVLLALACGRGLPVPRADMVLPGRDAAVEELPARDLFAERLTGNNFETRRVGGPQSIGGRGDWALGNGEICAVVSDVSHEAFFTANGGQLVDLGHCGAHDDQWTAIQLHLRNMRPEQAIATQSIEARVEGNLSEDLLAVARHLGISFDGWLPHAKAGVRNGRVIELSKDHKHAIDSNFGAEKRTYEQAASGLFRMKILET